MLLQVVTSVIQKNLVKIGVNTWRFVSRGMMTSCEKDTKSHCKIPFVLSLDWIIRFRAPKRLFNKSVEDCGADLEPSCH